MSASPPQPPPREPSLLPKPQGPSPWRLALKVALYVVGGLVLLVVVGFGLILATCAGLA